MTIPFMTLLRDEIATLETSLSHDPRFQKLQHLKSLLALYESPTPLRSVANNSLQPTSERGTAAVRQPSATRLQAEELSAQYMAGRNEPTRTRELWEMLSANGVDVGGKDPVSNLSAILSRSAKFRPIGRAGWLLAESAHDVDNESRQGPLAHGDNGETAKPPEDSLTGSDTHLISEFDDDAVPR